MEDLGIASTVVGIEVIREDKHTYSICQSMYASKILQRFDSLDLKPAITPLPPGLKLFKPDLEEITDFASKRLPYRSVVGSLMYLAQCTRPDLAYAVGILSQHLDWPGYQHWNAATHVLRYLSGTINLGIRYSGAGQVENVRGIKSQHCPQALCDADWAGDKDTRRSTTGYLFILAGGAVSWRSKLQPTVALSSTEAEYRAITEAGQELIWLRTMLKKLGYEDSNPTVLQSDNMGAIHLTNKTIFHARTKHIEIHYHWIREVVKAGKLTVQHCPTHLMTADLLTKSLGTAQFTQLRKLLGLKPISC